jgi:outer membrane PBP1 activator LpoA protein
VSGWAQLIKYGNKYGANSEQFSRYLSLWQRQYPTHPATSIIDQLQPTFLNTTKVENIAVLLPLSGSQKKAGLAAQQGILAAYENSNNNNITFIDTNNVIWENLPSRFIDLNIDHIIGPLLKPNVEAFLAISSQHIPLQVPTLLLNLSSQLSLENYQFALSMRPEDEAVQAAATLSQQSYTNPIILSHQDRVSKRIALAFSEQWKSDTGAAVDIVYFNQGKAMQTSLKESLDVNTSEARIKQLNSRLKHNIKSEPRNRRDIDMIYLVGTAAQTRLIKPYIDVNISPFLK